MLFQKLETLINENIEASLIVKADAIPAQFTFIGCKWYIRHVDNIEVESQEIRLFDDEHNYKKLVTTESNGITDGWVDASLNNKTLTVSGKAVILLVDIGVDSHNVDNGTTAPLRVTSVGSLYSCKSSLTVIDSEVYNINEFGEYDRELPTWFAATLHMQAKYFSNLIFNTTYKIEQSQSGIKTGQFIL